MAKYLPHYKLHRDKFTKNYYIMLDGSSVTFHITRGKPAGTNKIHYYTGTTWYPTLRDAIYSII